ncbi:phage BR0599 family protein [Hyphomicrobium sp.]|uniref:phage BR0599 family protein n=1 Tax=Hyphomicrobium sp. TaxID=82 RepID=UPI001DBF362A|nr:phage BR0599 family protein [Hyphomicrobium sp.]MBY0560017.1 phage BR0599 family protein [Hyphomicrobium sp.]
MSFGGGGNEPIDNYKPGKGMSRVVTTRAFDMKYGISAGAEPAWPTTDKATFTDANGITWQAIRARRITSTVTGVFGRTNFSAQSLSPYPDDFFQYGVLKWLTGENAALQVEVHAYKKLPAPNLELFEATPFEIVEGDTFEVVQGCAKTRTACKVTFNNNHNHRGFPDMPTEEKALATPNFSQQGKPKQDSGGS